MPSLITHLKISQSINNKLQLPNSEFHLGNLLPDLSYGNNHKESHYSHNRIPNIKSYLNDITSQKLTPLEIGYLCHLLTDKYYNEFIFNNYIELNNNNLVSIKINGNKEFYNEKIIDKIKHSVYDNYDSYIIKYSLVEVFNNVSFINDFKIPKINNILFDKEFLKEQIQIINYTIINNKSNYKNTYAFSSQEELDKIFCDCCTYILQFIEDNHILDKKGDKQHEN